MDASSVTQERECVECKKTLPLTGDSFPFSGNSRLMNFRRQCRQCYNAECKVRDRRKGTKIPCKHCQQPFDGRRKDFCSEDCRILHSVGGIGAKFERLEVIGLQKKNKRNYLVMRCDCSTVHLVAPSNVRFGHVKSCGCYGKDLRKTMHGANAANWKGGRSFDTQGYVRLHMPGHPNAYESDNTVLEHLYVMSECLGRPIRTKEGENVHHKNGIRHDNRIENLELWTQAPRAGQRIEDLVASARWILATYEADARKLQRRHLTVVEHGTL